MEKTKNIYKSEERNRIENGRIRHLDRGPESDDADATDERRVRLVFSSR